MLLLLLLLSSLLQSDFIHSYSYLNGLDLSRSYSYLNGLDLLLNACGKMDWKLGTYTVWCGWFWERLLGCTVWIGYLKNGTTTAPHGMEFQLRQQPFLSVRRLHSDIFFFLLRASMGTWGPWPTRGRNVIVRYIIHPKEWNFTAH